MLSGYSYRKSHDINAATDAGTDYQVKVIVHYGSGSDSGEDVYTDSKCATDFGDIRFTDDDGDTELDYWMEEKTDSDNAIFWVEVIDNLSTVNQTIYIYYGNITATTTSNGENTFRFFDDFNDDSLDVAKWNEGHSNGSYSESGGILAVTGGAGAWEQIGAKTQFGVNTALEAKISSSETDRFYFGLDDRSVNGSVIGSNVDQAQFAFPSDELGKKYRTSYEASADPTDTARTSNLSSMTRVYIIWISGKATFYDGSVTEVTLKIPTDNMGVTLWAYNGVTTVSADWVAIRKYVDPEPAHGAWGSEETIGVVAGSSIVPILQGIGIL